MSVTQKDVEHIAALARLEFSEQEKETFTHQLNQILTYVEQLRSLDTSKVQPLSHVIELKNRFRADDVKESIGTDQALQNAPAKTDKFFKVPKVITDKS